MTDQHTLITCVSLVDKVVQLGFVNLTFLALASRGKLRLCPEIRAPVTIASLWGISCCLVEERVDYQGWNHGCLIKISMSAPTSAILASLDALAALAMLPTSKSRAICFTRPSSICRPSRFPTSNISQILCRILLSMIHTNVLLLFWDYIHELMILWYPRTREHIHILKRENSLANPYGPVE